MELIHNIKIVWIFVTNPILHYKMAKKAKNCDNCNEVLCNKHEKEYHNNLD